MRAALELELGTRPNARRIAKLWTRRAGTDCITEVGMPDPLRGGIVLAIFDMGQQRPFVVWWRPHGGIRTDVRESVGLHAHAAVEFDSLSSVSELGPPRAECALLPRSGGAPRQTRGQAAACYSMIVSCNARRDEVSASVRGHAR